MKKLSMSLLLLAIMILSISVVSATDADVSADLANAPDDVAINAADDASVLANPTDFNFTKLQQKIIDEDNIELDGNYQRLAGENNIIINKNVKITGTAGRDTIDANNLGRIFNVNPGCNLTLIGVKLINGKANDYGGAIFIDYDSNLTIDDVTFENNTAAWFGGAIYDQGSRVNITISNSKFINNTAGWGAGAINVVKEGSSLTIDHTDFKFNKAYDIYTEGGAIMVQDLNSFKLDYCNFINNTAESNGAISITQYGSEFGDVNINNTNFINNTATTGNSGAVSIWADNSVWSNSIAIENTKFINNTATAGNGGALNIKYAINVNIKKSEFINNNAVNGEAIYIRSNAAANIENSNFTNNGEDTDYSIYNLGTLSLSGNDIDNKLYNNGTINTQYTAIVLDNKTVYTTTGEYTLNATLVDDKGNLIYDDNLKFTVNGVEIANQPAYNDGVYTLLYNQITEDNSIYIISVNTTNTDSLVTNTGTIVNPLVGTFTDLKRRITATSTLTLPYNFIYNEEYDNAIKTAGGIPISSDVIIDGDGHTICGNDATRIFNVGSGVNLTLKNAIICDGKSNMYGGAILIGHDSNLTIDEVTFENNTATMFGGAIYDEGSRVNITISNSNFINNTAGWGAGAICAVKENSSLTIDHTDFKFNEAYDTSSEGGAIMVQDLNSFKLDYCNFINNTAESNGAISITEYGSEFGDVNINNTNFINNTATNGNSGAFSIWANSIWSNPIAIENTKFINNTATAGNGGALNIRYATNVNIKKSDFINNNANTGEAIYIRSNACANIENSIFTNNGEDTGYSIYNYGNLTLSQNTISTSKADIVNFGEILSQLNIIVLDNETKNINSFEADLYAKITDDNQNLINDSSFNFTINTENVAATYDNALYKAIYTFADPGLYPVSMISTKNQNLNVTNGSIRFKANSTVKVNGVDDAVYGDNITVTFTIPADGNATGVENAVIYNADGKPVIGTVININNTAKTIKIAAGLNAGTYTLNVTTIPINDNYLSVNKSATIVIGKAGSDVSVPVVSFIYGGSQTVTVTVVNSTGAIHAQLLNSSGRPVTVGNATVKGKQVTVSGLPVGYYTLEVTVDADDNYQSATGDNLVIVNAKSTSNVTVPPVSFVYGESGTVTVKVTGTTGAIHAQLLDTNGTPLTIGKVIVNGKKVTVSNLPVGNYVLNVTADADDRYEGASGNNSVVVSKAPSSVVINNIIDGAYKTVAANVDYTVTNRTTVTFKISNKTSVVVNETAIDQLEAKLFGLNIGNYTITIINAENDNYYGDEDSGNFTVTKGYVNMAITSKDVVYPNDVVVTVMSDVSGNYSLFKGITSPKYIVLEAGVAQEVNFTDMDAGTYEFALVYLETEYYNTGRKAVNVTVDKANVNMAITSNDVVYPEDVVVTVVSDVSGNYSLYHGTTSPIDIVLEAGVAQEVNFSKVDAGTHEFTLAYLETQNYKAANKSVSVNIAKGNVNMTITAKDVIYPNDVVLTLLSDVSGNYSLYKGITAPQYIDLEAGVAKEVKFSKLDVDTYEFTLVYFETQNYKTSMESVNVDVSKGNVTINISASDVTYPDDIILNLLSDVSGTYDLYLGSVAPFKINLEAGVVKTLECAEFEAGTHEFTLAYLGSTNYNPARESINVTVSKGNVNMNITAKDVTYPDDVVLTLLSDVSGNYSLFKGITSPQDIVLEAGVAKEVKFSDLNAGTYEFALVYLETENYTTGRTAINVTVNKVENTTMSVNVTTPVATENATVTVTLPADATGNVSVKYGNGVYFADVVNGTAVVSVPTTVAGTETADVIYSGDNNYASVSSEVNITVKVQGVIIAENIKRGVNSSYDYYATLVNAEGLPISDVEITFTIDGKTYKAKTNASGIATVSAGLVVKDGKDTVYNVTVTNPYTFENTTATTTIVPRLIVVSGDLTADYLENPPYIVQAIGDDGEHVGANVTVRIVFAGFYYDLQTNETGHVVRTIALAPGSYAVRGEYLGYKTEQTPFQVLQILQASSGTLKKKTAKTYTLKATLKHSNGKAIANAEVKLNFNGKNYKVKTNSKGVASYTLKSSQISKLQAGKTYILKALYINDWTKGKWQGKIKVVNK